MVPARLDIRSSSPSLSRILTSWPIRTSRLRVRVVADAGAHIAMQPADVAVVVGAEQVDAAVEAAVPLVEVVGGVGGEVGRARRRT